VINSRGFFIMDKFLIVGLGNIGNEYEHTRHNIGFDILDFFVQQKGGLFQPDRLAFRAEVKLKGKLIVCIKPTTFMNLSGKAVKYWMDKEKIDVSRLFVLLDELAVPLEKIKIKPAGSDGGHNGLKSIQELLGHSNYPRLRFGIGNDFPKGRQVEHVLGKWAKKEEPVVLKKIEKSAEAIEQFVLTDLQHAMNTVNNLSF
jgi:PTH1 family peptidyl-tRNA hydrolase